MTIEEKIEALKKTIAEETQHEAALWKKYEAVQKEQATNPLEVAKDEWYKAHCQVELLKGTVKVLEAPCPS